MFCSEGAYCQRNDCFLVKQLENQLVDTRSRVQNAIKTFVEFICVACLAVEDICI